jgi:hypothetical protein
MCSVVRLNQKVISSPRQLREEIGQLVWREKYIACASHDVWLDSCLCSIDVVATVTSAGLRGEGYNAGRHPEFIVESVRTDTVSLGNLSATSRPTRQKAVS